MFFTVNYHSQEIFQMIYRNTSLLRFLIIIISFFLISLTYIYLHGIHEYISYSNQRIIKNDLINNINTSNTKLTFVIDKGYWNFNLSSFLQMKLEADISPDINTFIRNNADYLKNVYNLEIPVDEQSKHSGSMSSAGVKIKISNNETITLIFSRIWFSKATCHGTCNPDRSFIYVEALTSDYRKTSYNITSKNGKMIKFPGILNITEYEVNVCCLGPEDPRMVLDENNQVVFTFNMMDTR